MMDLKIIKKKILIKSLRDFILDNEIDDEKIIILNKYNFDDIILDHLEFYKESAKFPYKMLGVLIEEDPFNKVPLDKIGIINYYDHDFGYIEESKSNFF